MSDKITTSCVNLHTMPVFSQFIAKYKKYGRTRNNKETVMGTNTACHHTDAICLGMA
jgi:hypothetical protein